jgi:hypothetical protein
MSQAMLSQAMLSQAGVARISIDEDASAPGSACLQVPDGFEAPPTRNAVIRLGGNSEGVLCVRLASTTWPHSESPRNDSPTTRCLRRHPQRSIVGMRHRQRTAPPWPPDPPAPPFYGWVPEWRPSSHRRDPCQDWFPFNIHIYLEGRGPYHSCDASMCTSFRSAGVRRHIRDQWCRRTCGTCAPALPDPS